MSYIRYGYPLRYFDGTSKSYVYPAGMAGNEHIEDHGDNYEDNCSLIELIGILIERETKDKDFAYKIMSVLAKKLGEEIHPER